MWGIALTVSLWQRVAGWDHHLFKLLNQKLANPVLDAVLPFLRDSVFWAPLYLFIAVFVLLNWGRQGAWWSIAFIATVALTDLVGTYGFKETIERVRPCNNLLLQDEVRLILKRCPGGYSFISNHAANHFGLATFMVATFKPIFKRWTYLAYAWAALICFAQVYVGAHYPLDVAAGAALGVVAGLLTASVYRHNFGPLLPLT